MAGSTRSRSRASSFRFTASFNASRKALNDGSREPSSTGQRRWTAAMHATVSVDGAGACEGDAVVVEGDVVVVEADVVVLEADVVVVEADVVVLEADVVVASGASVPHESRSRNAAAALGLF